MARDVQVTAIYHSRGSQPHAAPSSGRREPGRPVLQAAACSRRDAGGKQPPSSTSRAERSREKLGSALTQIAGALPATAAAYSTKAIRCVLVSLAPALALSRVLRVRR